MTTPLIEDNEPHWRRSPDRRVLDTFEHELPPPNGDHRWVYLWHLPIRAMHWIAVGCIFVLFVTGFYIGRPLFTAGIPTTTFMVQWVRLAHFIAGGLLVATALVRTYWLFVGNRFERLASLFPVRGRDWVNLWKMIRYYLMIHPERAPHYLGHNPLQQLFYTFTYVVAFVLVLTGFVLFGQAMPGTLLARSFEWMAPYLGGMQMVRSIHHVAMWYFPLFVIFHVYLAVRADLLDRSGTMSSMVSGGRFVPVEEEYVDG